MSYTPEEYELLKEFYKRDWKERKAFLEEMRLKRLRQRAEWHLSRMEDSLRAMGFSGSETPPPSPSSVDAPDKTIF